MGPPGKREQEFKNRAQHQVLTKPKMAAIVIRVLTKTALLDKYVNTTYSCENRSVQPFSSSNHKMRFKL